MQHCTQLPFGLQYVLRLTCAFQIVHGLSVPVGKLGQSIPRTLSTITSTNVEERPAFQLRDQIQRERRTAPPNGQLIRNQNRVDGPQRPVWRIGGSIIPPGTPKPSSPPDEELGGETSRSPDLVEDAGLNLANSSTFGSTCPDSNLAEDPGLEAAKASKQGRIRTSLE